MKNPKKLLIALIALDLFVVILHLLFGYQTTFFNLDEEMNFPAFYQGIKLAAGGMALLIFVSSRRLLAFLPLGLLLIYLGIDEVVQIHEEIESQIQPFFPQVVELVQRFAATVNYTSNIWVLYFVPAIFGIFLYMLFIIRYVRKFNPRLFPSLFLGSTLFILVIIFEIINSSGRWGFFEYQILMTLEESFEMFGASIFCYFSYLLIKRHAI